MERSFFRATLCAECYQYAEPPFTPLFDLFGTRTGWVVCLDCYDAILPPRASDDTADAEPLGNAD